MGEYTAADVLETRFASVQQARSGLYAAGYVHQFSPPGWPSKWRLGDDVRAVAVDGDAAIVVPYPNKYEPKPMVVSVAPAGQYPDSIEINTVRQEPSDGAAFSGDAM